MDEPFGALDVQTKAIMSNELLGLWEQTRPTVIFITHDLEEAVALADKVVVMTVGPGTIKAVFDIDLPRPRGAVQEIRFDPRFRELHHQIWDALREEVQRAYERTAHGTEQRWRITMSALSINAELPIVSASDEATSPLVRAHARGSGSWRSGARECARDPHDRQLAAARRREDRRSVLLGQADRDHQPAEGLGQQRDPVRLALVAGLDDDEGGSARLRVRRHRGCRGRGAARPESVPRGRPAARTSRS